MPLIHACPGAWRMLQQVRRQTAWQIIVGTDSIKSVERYWVIAGKAPKTISADQLVTYQGKALMPFTKYFWKVVLWDQSMEKYFLLPHRSF